MRTSEKTTQHDLFDDIQGMSLGIFMAGFGLHLLTTVGLITGQTAGVAVILSYLTDYSFGTIFFVINLPFYLLAWRRLGRAFTIKSLISVSLLSVFTDLIPRGFDIAYLHPAFGAVAFGAITGVGLLALFRHNGSLGGLGVVALLIQDTTGFRAGWVQLIFDAVVFGAAFLFFESAVVLYSLLGAMILNVIIAVNHRRDRYIAT
ncbi:YitT family protein [Yoonia sp. BS5-3]|uniref:YitT family protein n=1 Tax=Yoonia phaeophyticola TaxID=3137369 RepID=A0ABZ2V6G7_9RHOB